MGGTTETARPRRDPASADPTRPESRKGPVGTVQRAPSLARRRAMMEVSKAYYIDEMSKTEIARELDLSRFQVARMLQRARDIGIVSITLNSGAPMPDLGDKVRAHLGLRSAEVVEAYGDRSSLRRAVGTETGSYLASRMREGEVLGLGWGRTLNAMLDRLTYLPSAEVVQLSGWFNGATRDGSVELARRAIALTGGTAKAIPAPFFTDDARAVALLRRRPEVAEVMAAFDRLTTAVVSLGAVGPQPITITYTDVPDRLNRQIIESGPVAEVCGNLFGADGCLVDSSVSRHTLNITARQLRRIPRVVMAAAHTDKTAAVWAVCAAGIPTDVVLDVELADALLRMPPVGETPREAEVA
jgi:DNA-binding transcriptional regulator LsrR (DeoR family)